MKKWAAGSWANSRRRASSPVTRPTRRANANGQGKVPPPRCGQRGTVGRHADSRLGAEAEPRRRADSRPQGRRRDERPRLLEEGDGRRCAQGSGERDREDRKRVVWGKGGSVRVDSGGRRVIIKTTHTTRDAR